MRHGDAYKPIASQSGRQCAALKPQWYIEGVKSPSTKPRARKPAKVWDINSPDAVERFREAAQAFTKAATQSRAAAIAVLVEEGIYTKSGKLTKNYR